MTNNNKIYEQISIITQIPIELLPVLFGIVISDGYIALAHLQSTTGALRISFGRDRLRYALFIGNLLSAYSNLPLIKTISVVGKFGIFNNYRFGTRNYGSFRYIHSIFYKYSEVKGKWVKIIPLNIESLLTAVLLAFLIMGDGNYDKQRPRVRIYTNPFTFEEVTLLANAIINKFNIKASVLLDRRKEGYNDQYIITIGKLELPKLQALVAPHMHGSMLYRIGLPNTE